jgi:putative transposase
VLAVKSVKQNMVVDPVLLPLMAAFKHMVSDCIRTGLTHDVSTTVRLSKLCYSELDRYDIYAAYKLCAISRAAGILANRKHSLKRGFQTRTPYLKNGMLVSYIGFKVVDGVLKVPLGSRQYVNIPLTTHTRKVLSDPSVKVRSFTLTASTISICYSKEVAEIESTTTVGVDRNLANVTVGNSEQVVMYNLSKTVDVAENSRSVMRAFRRNDARIRRRLSQKNGRRKRSRVNQLLHKVSKAVVKQAKEQKAAIVFEDIRGIRQLYLRGNGQRRENRFKFNSWPFYELKRQITYKATWEGVRVIQLTKGETRKTSILCPRCGERTQEDREHRRQLWCPLCKKWQDRDVVAAMNIARKGLLRFSSPQGAADEAMVRERGGKEPLILKVDAAKLVGGLSQRQYRTFLKCTMPL